MDSVFVLEDNERIISIHATRESAERAFKEYTKGKSQEFIDDYGYYVRKERLYN